ncbi:hypothetical protein [Methanooceanicella nereidis]|uniref:hypothetical protein n=1 Tax=Methanooceanicella nereidis TaxID=2052831 RepID=UPI001E646C58|nr:hypothetical protein [Methanocella sp. CWC-04]
MIILTAAGLLIPTCYANGFATGKPISVKGIAQPYPIISGVTGPQQSPILGQPITATGMAQPSPGFTKVIDKPLSPGLGPPTYMEPSKFVPGLIEPIKKPQPPVDFVPPKPWPPGGQPGYPPQYYPPATQYVPVPYPVPGTSTSTIIVPPPTQSYSEPTVLLKPGGPCEYDENSQSYRDSYGRQCWYDGRNWWVR